MNASTGQTANDLDPRCGGREPADSSTSAPRLKLGRIIAELHRFPTQTSVQVRVGASEIVLLTPLTGCVERVDGASGASGVMPSFMPGSAVFLGRSGVSALVGAAGATGVLLHLPRDEFQALISRKRNQPTRLAVVDLVASTPPALLDVVSAVARALASEAPFGEAATSSLRYRLEGALLETFVSEASWGPLLQTPRAVSRAVAAIEEGAVFDPERLAAVSGVTARTLREGFVAVFGMSLTAYLQRARLERARQSLASGYDSRSIPQVGKESGFSTAPAFTRAYVRAFGESPSETRARAVHASPLTAGRGSVPA